jgi:YD repeat-containing protein
VSDPAGKDRKTVTDGLGRVSQVFENPSGANLPTTYTYNAANSLLSVHQSGAAGDIALADRSFTYDLLQRLKTASNPESETTSYPLYDSDGNLGKKIDANGTTTSMNYDELDRLTSKFYQPSATPPSSYAATPTATYTYGSASVPNSAGRLTQVSNGSTSQIFGYDLLGRPTATSQTTNSTVYTFPSYTYNLNNQLKTITYPSGRTITTTYDSAGRTSQVSGQVNNIGPITTYGTVSSYAPHGGIQQMTLGALTEQTCYNNRLQPVGIRLGGGATTACSNATGADVLNLSYGYGTTNNHGAKRTCMTDTAIEPCRAPARFQIPTRRRRRSRSSRTTDGSEQGRPTIITAIRPRSRPGPTRTMGRTDWHRPRALTSGLCTTGMMGMDGG